MSVLSDHVARSTDHSSANQPASRGEHMAFRRDSRPAPDQIEAVIGPRATFDGRLRCDGSVRVDGTVEGGSIETLGNVLITAGARVTADIKAKTVSVAGGYKGTIIADRVELLEGGRLWGIHQRADLPAGRRRALRRPIGDARHRNGSAVADGAAGRGRADPGGGSEQVPPHRSSRRTAPLLQMCRVRPRQHPTNKNACLSWRTHLMVQSPEQARVPRASTLCAEDPSAPRATRSTRGERRSTRAR